MTSQEALVLNDESHPTIRLHATTVFAILNSHTRREDKQSRVIGSLLGYANDGFIEVTDCFAVPHLEKIDEIYVAINKDYQKTMYNFHRKVNRKETLLGWYSTTRPRSAMIIDNSSLIHDYYSVEVKNPLHLVVDTNLNEDMTNNNNGNLFNIRAYISQPMVVGEHALANMFHEVKVELSLTEAEVICLNQMIHQQVQQPPFSSVTILSTLSSSVEEITNSTTHLSTLLEKISGYLNEVTEGTREADPEIGILLTDLLSGLQVVSSDDFKSYFESKVQDMLMVSYLSSLTKSQILVAEKLIRIL